MSETPRKFVERRKGTDIWVKLISWFSAISWVMMFIVLYIVTKAGPQIENYFHKLFNASLRKTWDYELAQYALYLMILLLMLCLFGILINAQRHKRKSDKYSLSLIIMSILSVVGIFVYLIYIY